jgi:hypothetical protein
MPRYPKLSAALQEQLFAVPPSIDGELRYRPCRLVLQNGAVVDRAFVQDAPTYIRHWGVWPEDDKGKQAVALATVARIEPSPDRLPAHIATRLYEAGESGMGYCVFTLMLRDGRHLGCVTGNAVDFVSLPADVRPSDIVDVQPGAGPRDGSGLGSAKYAWCLYEQE